MRSTHPGFPTTSTDLRTPLSSFLKTWIPSLTSMFDCQLSLSLTTRSSCVPSRAVHETSSRDFRVTGDLWLRQLWLWLVTKGSRWLFSNLEKWSSLQTISRRWILLRGTNTRTSLWTGGAKKSSRRARWVSSMTRKILWTPSTQSLTDTKTSKEKKNLCMDM